MNSIRYNEIYFYTKYIHDFKQMVMSEQKHKLLSLALASLASIERSEAIEFIREYYSRMDIVLTAPAVLFNELSRQR